jgi:predicted HTH transcriptional regulator
MDELQRILLTGENDQVDFKQRVTHPEKIARTLVSFANTRGGIILVGVKDNGYICGIDPEEEKYTLELAANFYCNPPLQIVYEEIESENRVILKVTVPDSKLKPHFAKVKEGDWRSYVRVKDSSIQTINAGTKKIEPEPDKFEQIPLNQLENAVLDYLTTHPRITRHQFMKMVSISERRAYRILIKLALHGYIRFHENESEEYYTLR